MALRVSEIASVQWTRFDDRLEWYTVTGKLDETYSLPVHPVLRDDLRYVRRDSDFVFAGSRGRDHVTAATVWGWVHVVCGWAGIDEVSPHVLRHTAITTANDATGDLRAVSAFARHKRLETTRLYTRTTDQQLERVVNAINYDDE
jgi:integrase